MSHKRKNGRHQFDAVYVLRQARGLPTTEGHAVITKEFAQFLEDELERLYAIEEAATAVTGITIGLDFFDREKNLRIPPKDAQQIYDGIMALKKVTG